MRTVFLDRDSLDFGDLDLSLLSQAVETFTCYSSTEPEAVAERISNAEIIIVNKVVLDEALMRQAPALKLICVAATGTNNVDLDAASRLGVCVCNCQGYGTASVAQHVFTLVLALSTSLLRYHQAVQAGAWGRSRQFCLLDYPIMELEGKTLGIVGYGELGQAVARLAEAFGMRVLIAARSGTAPSAGRLALSELLPQVDVLSLHCPLTDATRDLIGAEQLALLKPGALLINAARGGVVNELALLAALQSGRLGGAGVDVLSEEPPRNGNPLLGAELPNLIVTPHSAWGSCEARQRIVGQLSENIQAWMRGSPRRCVAR